MVDRPEEARLEPADAAILALATSVTERPWAMRHADYERARGAGLGDDAIVQAVVLSAYFNYLNRVADAVDIELDYESPLPRPDRDALREGVARPARETWPTGPAFALRLAARPGTAEAFRQWREYVLERESPLSRRDRAVLVRAVAGALCDARTVEEVGEAGEAEAGSKREASKREAVLAEYAEVLTVTPWRLSEEHVKGLRGLGLEDRGVLSVASFQNTASRVRLVLGE
jgi:alkylhydroperoxidase family enzyme